MDRGSVFSGGVPAPRPPGFAWGLLQHTPGGLCLCLVLEEDILENGYAALLFTSSMDWMNDFSSCEDGSDG
jgi:hypothetical protein